MMFVLILFAIATVFAWLRVLADRLVSPIRGGKPTRLERARARRFAKQRLPIPTARVYPPRR